MTAFMYERERQQVTLLMTLLCCTVFTIVLTGNSILMGWNTGAVVLVLLGIAACWVLHVTEGISGSIRIWLYFSMTMLEVFLYGIHESSMYDLAPLVVFLILMYSATEMRVLVNVCMAAYYAVMCYDFLFVLDGSAQPDPLTVSRTAFHFVLVYAAGYWAKVVMSRRGREKKKTDSKIAELRETNLRMEDLLANVSHELRTPINVVTGVTAVMLKNEEDAEKRKDILSIQMAGRRLFGQIEDILDYTEIEAGKIRIGEEPYMLSSLINDVVSGKQLSGRASALELIFDIDAGIPSELLGDGRKIKKIIRHLVDNALKFTKKGGVYVRLYALPKTYGVNLCIKVSDTGIGVDEENLEKISEKFFQTNGGRNRSVGGLGLGLPIVYGMVSAMEGFMQIESNEETGTTITVSIPQKVLDPSPCMELKNRQDLCIACFLKAEVFESPRVRDYYNETIAHMVQGLGVPLHRISNLEELKRLCTKYQLTHLIIGKAEYEESAAYLESQYETDVIVVADDSFVPPKGSRVKHVRTPFYCLPLVSALNAGAEDGSAPFVRKKMICPDVRVLVVDDDPLNLTVAEGIFKDYQMEVRTAYSGAEAIELCAKEDFDLIFLDHMMPEMDGVETLKRIRQVHADEGGALTVIAFTANAVSGAREMFLQEGFDEFISKPIESLELERVLRKVLPKSSIAFVDEKDPERNLAREPETSEDDGSLAQGKDEESRKGIGQESAGQESGGDPLACLERAGINTQSGIRYCRGDRDFYAELLIQFARNEEQRASEINGYFREEDLGNYEIRIHSLKSTAKMVGADALSELARKAEDAAKASDAGYIREHHEEIMARYHALSQHILRILAPSGKDAGQAAQGGGTKLSDKEMIRRLAQLKEVLDTFEADKAESLLAEMGGLSYRGRPAGELLRDIGRDVDDFEFSSAAGKVETLMEKIEGGEMG